MYVFCVGGSPHMCDSQMSTGGRWFFPSTMLVLRIELWSPGLAGMAFTH